MRVGKDGKVTRGVRVRHTRGPQSRRVIAAPYRVIHTLRFAPGGIPAGVDQHVPCPWVGGNCPTCRAIDDNIEVIL